MYYMTPATCRTLLATNDWQPAHIAPPAPQRDWLLHAGSLTAKLREHGSVGVSIAHEGWNDGAPREWQRDVWLTVAGVRWIYAETRIPADSHAALPLQQLGATPIGDWLYQQNPQRLPLRWRHDPASGLYARQSTLLIHGEPIHIAELFLPAFPWP